MIAPAGVGRLTLEDRFPQPRHATARSARWVYVHMIEEYARHNGHADLLPARGNAIEIRVLSSGASWVGAE